MPFRVFSFALLAGVIGLVVELSACGFDSGTTAAITVTASTGGSVTSLPAGISCGTDCTEDVAIGTLLTLIATPDANYTFAGWSGGGCSGIGSCTLTVDANTESTATFVADPPLTVAVAGTGTGRVTSSPGGIDCGTDCSELFFHGTVVRLTAIAEPGSRFVGWSDGSCSGTGDCELTLVAATQVTANFSLDQVGLTVMKIGTGSGTVTSSPGGINCGADCQEIYGYGSVVTLTANPNPSSIFAGWSGEGCSGTATCTVAMTAARTVTATFSCPSGSMSFAYTGAMQTFTVPTCVTAITVDAHGAQGGASTGESGGQNFLGGLGARVRGTFAVVGGQVINILVGGQGATNNCGGAGGGGSYVLRNSTNPAAADIMVIAAGGGGAMHCNYYGGTHGGGGQVTTSGGIGVPSVGGNPVPACVAGGTSGNGGTLNGFGGGGGGFLTSGQSQYDAAGGGKSFLTGGAGGTTGGGFGGGGGRYGFCCGGGGGGGGYSGGGGGSVDGCAGGGGGSLNNGTAQTNTAAVRSGHGIVTITY